MQWIDESDLETWARRLDGKALLADLVSDLILATVDLPRRMRFPGGDVSQIPGWDGDLEVDDGKGLVPDGKSKWEFGTGSGTDKAKFDYDKRTRETSQEERKKNTLVLVNLQTWKTKRTKLPDWERARNEEGTWRTVRYIDGVELVRWLDMHPAVAARYARKVLGTAPRHGVLNTDEYWAIFAGQFRNGLNEQVVIAGRKAEADALIAQLLQAPQSILQGADTQEESLAFAVAAIRSAEEPTRRLLEARTLVVCSQEAAIELSMRKDLVFLIADGAETMAGPLSRNCPTLSSLTGPLANKAQKLPRRSAYGMAQGFIAMGMDLSAAYDLAHRCGRSLTILKRLLPTGNVPPPQWQAQARQLKPAFLAGAWSARNAADLAVMGALHGDAGYLELEALLSASMDLTDRPMERVGDVWAVRSPVDAFFFYAGQLNDQDLRRLRAAVHAVFGRPESRAPRQEQLSEAADAPVAHSSWLREGLAQTLAVIATMHNAAGMNITGCVFQQFVDETISSLPSWGESHECLLRLGGEVQVLAEAAPGVFLRALETMLATSPEDVQKIFVRETGDFMAPTSPHVAILWALERLAWDPRQLGRVALVLARLAQLDSDPEAKLLNRPINSLRAILLGWAPNTYARIVQRIASLDAILEACPDVGWKLLVKLLPKPHDVSSRTRQPSMRDWVPGDRELVTFATVAQFQTAVVERCLPRTGDDATRLEVLVKHLGKLHPDNRPSVLAHLDRYLAAHQTADGCGVWHALQDEAVRHAQFADAEWTLKGPELEALQALVERYRPSNPLISDRLAFDDWMPHIDVGGAQIESPSDPDAYRVQVIDRVLARGGVGEVLRLCKLVRLPHLIPLALASSSGVSMPQLFELLRGALQPDMPGDLAFGLSGAGMLKFGVAWREAFAQEIQPHVTNDETRAKLLLGWPSQRSTWVYAETLGQAVGASYWKMLGSPPMQGTTEDLLFAIDRFRQHRRHLDVLTVAMFRHQDIPTGVLMDLLSSGVKHLDQVTAERMGNMLPYHVEKVLDILRDRDDTSETDIASLEYTYLPMMQFNYQPKTLARLMTTDASLFVEALSHLYRSENEGEDQPVTAQIKMRAETSFNLLSSLTTLPGQSDNRIDATALLEWTRKARSLAAQQGLTEPCDQQIGQLLAHAPQAPDEPFWPPKAVCQLIEATASKGLEHGFWAGCINKRGSYAKGMEEGGDQERGLARHYQGWADAAIAFARTSAVLQEIADYWLHRASGEDTSAELHKLKP